MDVLDQRSQRLGCAGKDEMGGSKGGKRRAANLSPEERSASAKKLPSLDGRNEKKEEKRPS